MAKDEKGIRMRPTLLLCLAALIPAGAWAQSQGQQFYAACLGQAEQEYRQCLRGYGREPGCGHAYRQEKNRCWNSYTQVERESASPYYLPPQRFEPVPIPQRPVYVLPGMR